VTIRRQLRQLELLRHWIRRRNPRYVALRLVALLRRYRITSRTGRHRLVRCVQLLARRGCRPTFPVPGVLVERHPRFFRQLEQMGAELALHGYDHVDFRSLSPAEATTQFGRAAASFSAAGVDFRGFRCPYLSCTEELADAVPEDRVRYSSNRAIWWKTPFELDRRESAVFTTLRNFYRPKSAEDVVSVPRLEGERVEIPVPLPDDLQLVDGLVLGEAGRERAAPVGPPMLPRSRRARLTRQRTKPAVGGQRTTRAGQQCRGITGYRDPTDPTLLPRVRTSLTI
jgi:peptidoglycan/xylan/chitin deacetylase (PgdA/CDA1 family)